MKPGRIRSRLLECCIDCEFHCTKQRERLVSYCTKENCFSEHSDCVMDKALDEFFDKYDIKSIHIINKLKEQKCN